MVAMRAGILPLIPRATAVTACAVLGLLLPPCLYTTPAFAQAPVGASTAPQPSGAREGIGEQDNYSRIAVVPRQEIDAWLKQQMQWSHDEPAQGRYRFVLGFSTAHYATDPVQALATRRLAFSLLNNFFTVGDHVKAVGWEMEVWKTGPDIPLTVDPADRRQVINTLPYTPIPQSAGGHDTERALYDVLSKELPASEASSTVVLLFTNTEQSQVGTGSRSRLFGESNPKLVKLLADLGYRPPQRMQFSAHLSSEGNSGGATIPIYVIGLFPKRLVSLPGSDASASRYPTFALSSWTPRGDKPAASDLANPPAPEPQETPTPAPPSNKSPWLLLYMLGGALIAGAALLLFRSLQGGARPKTASSPIPGGRTVPGRLLVTLGRGGETETLSPLRERQTWHIEVPPPAPVAVGTVVAGKAPPPAVLREIKETVTGVVDERASSAASASLIATLSLEQMPDRKGWRVVCAAAPGYQFNRVLAKDVDQSDLRRLLMQPIGGDFSAELVHASNPSAPSLNFKVRYQTR